MTSSWPITARLELFEVCTWYLSTLLFFAIVYEWLYRRDCNHFLFNAEILKRQKITMQRKLENDLSWFAKVLGDLEQLYEAISRKEFLILPESAPNEIFLSSGCRYAFTSTDFSCMTLPLTVLSVFEQVEGRRRCYSLPIFYSNPSQPEHFLKIAEQGITSIKQMSATSKHRLATIPTDSPQVWGPWDFLYFSVSVQTTMGLGDMLPNSTTVRKLVVLQVLLGLGLLSVVLNLILSQPH